MKFLPENLFTGSNVAYINFANNLIYKLEANSFENAQLDVSDADFSNNKIELLDEKLFEKWENLYNLFLSHNQIKVLPEKLFDGVKDSLDAVSFANNQISKIGNNTFVNFSDLEFIDLRNNTLFDVAFDGERDQYEVCSNNCEGSCFIVNEQKYIRDIIRPDIIDYDGIENLVAIVKIRRVCQNRKTLIRNKCRSARN